MKNLFFLILVSTVMSCAFNQPAIEEYEPDETGKPKLAKKIVFKNMTPKLLREVNRNEVIKIGDKMASDTTLSQNKRLAGQEIGSAYGTDNIKVYMRNQSISGTAGKKNGGGKITTASPEFTGSYRGNDGLYYLNDDEEQLVSFGRGAAEKIGHYLAGTGSRTQREFGQRLYLQKLERLAEALKE